MVLDRSGFRDGPACAFLGNNVKNRGCGVVLNLFQGVDQAIQMVTINRANVVEAQLMKQKSWDHKGLHGINHVFADFDEARTDVRNREQHRLDFLLKSVVDLSRHDPIEISRNGADIGRDRHFIVIQDDQQFPLQMTCLIDSFKSDTSREASIADDGDDMRSLPARSRATAMPSAAEMEVEA